MFGLCSPHILRGFYFFLLLLASGCLHPPFCEVYSGGEKGRGRLLRIRLAWAHGTLYACQMGGGGGKQY